MTDQLKIITSTLEFDPRSLEQPELDVDVVETAPAVRGGRAARSTLDRLLTRVSTRNAVDRDAQGGGRLAHGRPLRGHEAPSDRATVRSVRPPT